MADLQILPNQLPIVLNQLPILSMDQQEKLHPADMADKCEKTDERARDECHLGNGNYRFYIMCVGFQDTKLYTWVRCIMPSPRGPRRASKSGTSGVSDSMVEPSSLQTQNQIGKIAAPLHRGSMWHLRPSIITK